MLDLIQLRTFQIVTQTGSFTRAAMELGFRQSSVTSRIKSLEKELGVALFERHRFSRTITLTSAGRITLDYAERLLALADEATAAIRVGECQT